MKLRQGWSRTTVGNRPGAKDEMCAVCGEGFPMHPGGWFKTEIAVSETRVGWFRGDDIVEFAHPNCVRMQP